MFADHQPQRLNGCRIQRELNAVTRCFTQLTVHRLDRIRGVDNLPCRQRELQKWNELIPRLAPDLHRLWILLAELTGFKIHRVLRAPHPH